MRNTRFSSSLAVALAILLTAPVGFAECPGALPGDLDGDCDVDLADLAILLANYGQQWAGPPASLDWTVNSDPVMEPPCNDIGGQFVMKDGDLFKVWHDNSPLEEVWYAESEDGLVWDCSEWVYTPQCSNDAWPVVVKKDGAYHMWVGASTVSNPAGVDHVTSTDGINWEHQCCIEEDILQYSILPTEEGFEVWYRHDLDGTRYFRATSSDGCVWENHVCVFEAGEPGEFDEHLSYLNVVKECYLYHMWYACSPAGEPTRFTYATSEDGITWTKHGLLTGFEELPESHLATPSVVLDDGTLRMWFLLDEPYYNSVYYAETAYITQP